MTPAGRAGAKPIGRSPGDAHGLAVLVLAVILAAGTALSQVRVGRPDSPWPPGPAAGAPEPSPEGVGEPPGVSWSGAEDRPGARTAAVSPASLKRATPLGTGVLDLNAANVEALQVLPGIGPTLARRIVAYRETHGPFQAPEDLLQVPGIGPKRWERVRSLLHLGDGP